MLSFFKKLTKEAPKKGSSFYDRENLIQTIDELTNMLNQLNSDSHILTKSDIVFQGFDLSSINIKNLEKDFEEEDFILEPNSGISNHKIFFYKITSDHLKFLIQIHFTDDQFFFAGTKVYSESLLSTKDKNRISQQIENKYDINADIKDFAFNIVDSKGNVIYTNENIYLFIKYVPNNKINKNLSKAFSNYKKPDATQEINDTLDRLI